MDIKEKIQKAHAYVSSHNDGVENLTMLRNDAANIFADSYEEYEAIWAALLGTEGSV